MLTRPSVQFYWSEAPQEAVGRVHFNKDTLSYVTWSTLGHFVVYIAGRHSFSYPPDFPLMGPKSNCLAISRILWTFAKVYTFEVNVQNMNWKYRKRLKIIFPSFVNRDRKSPRNLILASGVRVSLSPRNFQL